MTVSAREPMRVLVYGPAAALIVYGLAAAELAGTYLAPRWLRPVGDASYSIYLIHCAVGWHAVIYGCYVPHNRLPHLGWLAGTFAACVAAGFALGGGVTAALVICDQAGEDGRADFLPHAGRRTGRVCRDDSDFPAHTGSDPPRSGPDDGQDALARACVGPRNLPFVAAARPLVV